MIMYGSLKGTWLMQKLFGGKATLIVTSKSTPLLDMSWGPWLAVGIGITMIVIAKLLPGQDAYHHYTYTIKIKHGNDSIGEVGLVISPSVEGSLHCYLSQYVYRLSRKLSYPSLSNLPGIRFRIFSLSLFVPLI